ncbi:MAG: hypothetical protein H7308_13280 [Chthonomonadaceae bacterium]|nr:hypothetical protein [Chthonomonadaceae bacterium]
MNVGRSGQWVANGSVTTLSSSGNAPGFSYSLSSSGRRLSMSGGGQFTSYGYDGAGRLLSESSPSQSYGLDAVGNRLSKTGATNYTYAYNANGNDWLMQVLGGTSLTLY